MSVNQFFFRNEARGEAVFQLREPSTVQPYKITTNSTTPRHTTQHNKENDKIQRCRGACKSNLRTQVSLSYTVTNCKICFVFLKFRSYGSMNFFWCPENVQAAQRSLSCHHPITLSERSLRVVGSMFWLANVLSIQLGTDYCSLFPHHPRFPKFLASSATGRMPRM